MDVYKEVIDAESRIRAHTLTTPLIESKALSKLIGGKVYLKLESEQHTGSFKARGSLNKLVYLQQRGITDTITSSSGNHALGYARALEITAGQGTVYLPATASKAKIEALKDYPVKVVLHDDDPLSTEVFAKATAARENKTWLSPYNDLQVIGGQGTIGIELEAQLDKIDSVLITMGGGGLISGVGSYLKRVSINTQIVGCEPENSADMCLSLAAGKIVGMEVEKETLSDGSAGGIEEDSVTFEICQSVVDRCLLVNEDEIAEGIASIAQQHHKIIEGAAGVVVASLVRYREQFIGQSVVLVICGANIALDKFKALI